jgi:hypothetical protein
MLGQPLAGRAPASPRRARRAGVVQRQGIVEREHPRTAVQPIIDSPKPAPQGAIERTPG